MGARVMRAGDEADRSGDLGLDLGKLMIKLNTL
jgi:hypothetical protein